MKTANDGSEKEKRLKVKKSPALYIVLIIVWAALIGVMWWQYAPGIARPHIFGGLAGNLAAEIAVRVLLILNAVFISYFWLNGSKDFLYVIWYYFAKRALEKSCRTVGEVNVDGVNDKVAMVYCTCNDFDGASLKKSMRQRYKNAVTVILDDSTKSEYIEKVDAFAAAYNVKVVRRADRKGFKAGNINNYLQSEEARAEGFKYFVILDSDEIIPDNFITECLKYFKYYSDAGIVQGGHVATRNRNFFMKLFHIGVNSHWNTYQTLKHRYGFCSLLGHGAMVSMECYEKAGGFPELVAEDLCISIEARNKGYAVVYAPNIVCQEEYPVDYMAFKKRHSKWTQGNMEFIKKYTGNIVRSGMKWYEKLDIVLFTYNLPLTAVFAFFIVINVIALPLLQVNLAEIYPWWMLIPTVVFFIAPMLNDIVFWLFRLNIFRFIAYVLCVFILYGSMFFTTFSSSLLGLLGKKAKFIVTPKSSEKISVWRAIGFQYREIIFSTVLIAIAVVCSYLGSGSLLQGVFAVILMSATGYLSVILPLFSNIRYSETEIYLDDGMTVNKTLAWNGSLRRGYKLRDYGG